MPTSSRAAGSPVAAGRFERQPAAALADTLPVAGLSQELKAFAQQRQQAREHKHAAAAAGGMHAEPNPAQPQANPEHSTPPNATEQQAEQPGEPQPGGVANGAVTLPIVVREPSPPASGLSHAVTSEAADDIDDLGIGGLLSRLLHNPRSATTISPAAPAASAISLTPHTATLAEVAPAQPQPPLANAQVVPATEPTNSCQGPSGATLSVRGTHELVEVAQMNSTLCE